MKFTLKCASVVSRHVCTIDSAVMCSFRRSLGSGSFFECRGRYQGRRVKWGGLLVGAMMEGWRKGGAIQMRLQWQADGCGGLI